MSSSRFAIDSLSAGYRKPDKNLPIQLYAAPAIYDDTLFVPGIYSSTHNRKFWKKMKNTNLSGADKKCDGKRKRKTSFVFG